MSGISTNCNHYKSISLLFKQFLFSNHTATWAILHLHVIFHQAPCNRLSVNKYQFSAKNPSSFSQKFHIMDKVVFQFIADIPVAGFFFSFHCGYIGHITLSPNITQYLNFEILKIPSVRFALFEFEFSFTNLAYISLDLYRVRIKSTSTVWVIEDAVTCCTAFKNEILTGLFPLVHREIWFNANVGFVDGVSVHYA